MRRSVGWFAGVWLLISGITEAGELNLGVETGVGYESNLFNRPSSDPLGDIDAADINLQLRGAVEDEFESGEYKLAYATSYSAKTAEETKPFWNHNAALSGVYSISPRTRMTLRNRFLFLEKLRLVPEDFDIDAPPAPSEDPDFDGQSTRALQNNLDLDVTHFFSPRWSGYASTRYENSHYTSDADTDGYSISGDLSVNYGVSRRLRLGAGARGGYQSFAGRTPEGTVTVLPPAVPVITPGVPRCFGETSPRMRGSNYSGFVSVGYDFDHSTSFYVQAGPAKIRSDSYVCPGNIFTVGPALFFIKFKDEQVTWFAQGSFIKRWRHLSTSLSYHRQQGFESGGDATVTDVVSGRVNLQTGRDWSLGLSGVWLRRDSLSGQRSHSWTAAARLSRRFLRRLSGRASVAYRTERGPMSRAYDSWETSVRVVYDLDPVSF